MCYISRYLKSHTIWSQSFFLSPLKSHQTHQSLIYPHCTALSTTHNSLTCKCATYSQTLLLSLILPLCLPEMFSHFKQQNSSLSEVLLKYHFLHTVFSLLSLNLMLTPFFPHTSYIPFTVVHSLVGYKLLEVRSHHIFPFLPKDTQTNVWFPASVPTKSTLTFVSSKWQTWEAS